MRSQAPFRPTIGKRRESTTTWISRLSGMPNGEGEGGKKSEPAAAGTGAGATFSQSASFEVGVGTSKLMQRS